MIVTTATASAMIVLDEAGEGSEGRECARVLCLARRDLLSSECEAFEHVRIGPGAHHRRTGRRDTETAWFVLRGPVVAEQRPEPAQHLADAGDLLLVPAGQDLELQAGPLGAELLCLTLHTPGASPRRPRIRRTTRP